MKVSSDNDNLIEYEMFNHKQSIWMILITEK